MILKINNSYYRTYGQLIVRSDREALRYLEGTEFTVSYYVNYHVKMFQNFNILIYKIWRFAGRASQYIYLSN